MKAAHQQKKKFSTKQVSDILVEDIKKALKSIDSYGSVELFVQDNVVTQITTRNIKKTDRKNGEIS